MVPSETRGLAGHGLDFSAKLNSEPSPCPEKRQVSLKIREKKSTLNTPIVNLDVPNEFIFRLHGVLEASGVFRVSWLARNRWVRHHCPYYCRTISHKLSHSHRPTFTLDPCRSLPALPKPTGLAIIRYGWHGLLRQTPESSPQGQQTHPLRDLDQVMGCQQDLDGRSVALLGSGNARQPYRSRQASHCLRL